MRLNYGHLTYLRDWVLLKAVPQRTILKRAKPWSISTTVRNPERLRDFLSVLSPLDGQVFDQQTQVKYQILLIQAKFYRPIHIPSAFSQYYENSDIPTPYEVAEQLFHFQNYEDPPMRGRQSLNPLKKLGFVVINRETGAIQITDLGKQFLSEDYDIGYIFFKSLLKLQYPNPISTEFSSRQGFNISPFVATLHVLKGAQEAGLDGLTRNEFCLFIPTLINAADITEQVDRIMAYRNSSKKQRFAEQYLRGFYNLEDLPETKINNLRDYGDNTMRYFRLTRYFRVRLNPLGDDWRIDLEPARRQEIQQLLSLYSGKAKSLNSQEYIDYMSDLSRPELPWEFRDNLMKIANDLQIQLRSALDQAPSLLAQAKNQLLTQNLTDFSETDLQTFIAQLRLSQLDVARHLEKHRIQSNTVFLQEIVTLLQNLSRRRQKVSPEQFEKLIHDLLRAVNDEIEIRPNYPIDDEGQPISHSPGNRPDIECYYQSFDTICEVTLDSGRSQWMREGQPVMRHLREFENRSQNQSVYCIFIAPRVHTDTYSQFWISVRYEYGGEPQRIIPLTIEQIIRLTEAIRERLESNMGFSHLLLQEFLSRAIANVEQLNGFSEWERHIETTLQHWIRETRA